MENKILKLESMRNMSMDEIIESYRNGYRLEGSNNNIQSAVETQSPNPDIQPIYSSQSLGVQSLNPDQVLVLYSQAYEQASPAYNMTVDLLVRNHNTTSIVVKFKIFDYYGTHTSPIKEHIACIPAYNILGCLKIRITGVPLFSPYDVYVYRCLNTPNCAFETCVAFDTNWDSTYYAQQGVVVWGGTIPDISTFPPTDAPNLNMAIDCATCTPAFVCETTSGQNTGYKYDACTGQRIQDIAMCPLPATVVPSKISIAADKTSPFTKGAIVRFSGTLESATGGTIISGATVNIQIRVGGAAPPPVSLTTTYARPNFIYDWTVPSTIASVDTAGMAVTAIINFSQTTSWTSATATGNYAIAGALCTGITLTTDKTTANVGELITVTSIVEPTSSAFSTVIRVDGALLGNCTTLPLTLSQSIGGQYGMGNTSAGMSYGQFSIGQPYKIKSMVSSISILNPPTSVVAGQVVNFQISCNWSVSSFGEWVKFRICSNNVEIGAITRLLFGTSSDIKSIDATIPASASGSISVKAELTIDEFSSTCGDLDVIATSSTVSIAISGTLNTMSIINAPTSVIAGQTVDIELSYNLTVSNLGEWVRFRICSGTAEIGHNITLLFGNSIGTISVSTVIPTSAMGTIVIKGEVATNELSSTCGDASVISHTSNRTISVTTQTSGTISIVSPPTNVRASQSVDFTVGYNLTVSSFGEWVRFRICSGGTQIGYSVDLLFGTTSGTVTINSLIPSGATGTVGVKAEVTTSELSGACGDSGLIASSSVVNMTVVTGLPGTCQLVWNTTGMAGGDHYITAQVLGQCSTGSPLRVSLIAPPAPCTSISIGAGTLTPVAGNIVTLNAHTLPTTSALSVTFKANGQVIGPDVVASAGVCTTSWNTTGLALGVYKLSASVESKGVTQCSSSLLSVTLSAPAPTCTVITAVTANPTTATIGTSVTLAATTTPSTAVFSVIFKDQNSVALGTVNTVSGVATLSWSTTGKTAGAYNIKAYVGTQCQSATATTVTLSVAPPTCASITAVTATPSTITIGSTMTLRATVSPTTSIFSVVFKEGGVALGAAVNTASGGVATFLWNTTGKTAGAHSIKASVGTQCESATATTVTLNPAAVTCASITAVTANPTTATIGTPVILTATATPSTTVFSVVFKGNGTALGAAVNTVNGVATFSWPTTGQSAGAYSVIASVGTQCTSASATTVTLNPVPVTCTSITAVTANPTTATIGGTVTLTATAQPSTTIFSVDFKDQSNAVLGTVNTVSGVATYPWPTTGKTAGTYNIRAFVGTQCNSPNVTSVILNTPAATCTSVTVPTATLTTVTVGTDTTLSAVVQPTTSSFTVDFKDTSSNVIGSGNSTVGTGIATYIWHTTGALPGTYQIMAYVGSTCVSTSAVQVTINPVATVCTSVSIPQAMPSTITAGGTLGLRATVQPTTTIFTVDFKDQDNVLIGSNNTHSGIATYNWDTTGRSAGIYYVTAYVGDTCVSPSSTMVTINPVVESCISLTDVIANPATVTIGDTVTLAATAQPTTSTFTVVFKDQDSNELGSADTVSGVATLPWSTAGKSSGTYYIKAYIGTLCQSLSATVVTINPAGVACTSVTDVMASLATVTIGGNVTLTAVVQPTTSIFTVEFKDQDNNVLGSVDTVSSIATYNWDTTWKTAGAYNIKAFVGTLCESLASTTVTLETPTASCTEVTVPTANPTTVTVGEVTTLSATVQPTTSSFTVDFQDQYNNPIGSGNTEIGTGIATYVWNTGTTTPGTYGINAYVGSTCISTSAVSVTITPTTTICASVTVPLATPTSVVIGDTLELRATVEPTSAIFAVVFKDQSSTTIGSVNTYSGVAVYNWDTTGKTAETYLVKAYVGDVCVSPSAVSVIITGEGGGTGSITFTTIASGVPLSGVEIIVDGISRGLTGADGTLSSPVSGLTLGITHLYSATILGYAAKNGSIFLTSNTARTIDMGTPTGDGAGGSGGLIGLIGVATLGMMLMGAKKQ